LTFNNCLRLAGLYEGGYYPSTGGYDVSYEVEYYNGTFNQCALT